MSSEILRRRMALDGVAAMQYLAHNQSVQSSWWKDQERAVTGDPILKKLQQSQKIALIHSEISEALEGIRKDKMDDHLPHRKAVEVELADAVIRILDFAGGYDLDLAEAILEKLDYNRSRADHQLEARAAAGGKSF